MGFGSWQIRFIADEDSQQAHAMLQRRTVQVLFRPTVAVGRHGCRVNFASVRRSGRIWKSKASLAQMRARREKRDTRVCASAENPQMSRNRRSIFQTKFALL